LIGSSNGLVENSYSKTNVTGSAEAGGLIGNTTNQVNYCYATGNVTQGSVGIVYFGGLLGRTNSSYGSTCYYCGTLSGGLTDNTYGTRKTSFEMQMQSTYSGWDFAAVWNIDPIINMGYPNLRSNAP